MKQYELKNNYGGKALRPCRFSCGYDGCNLIFEFRAFDSDIYCPHKDDNAGLWQGDVVGVFISPDGSQNDYYEFEAAPNGARFFAVVHLEKTDPIINPRTFEPVFFAETKSEADGYYICIKVPIAKLDGFNIGKARFNALCLDYDLHGRMKGCQALNPTFCGMVHVPKRFLRLAKYI